jgi:hypothetical protein
MKAAAVLLLLAPSLFAAEPPAIPLTKGAVWVYRGTVRGDNEKNDRVVKNVTTTMRVVDRWMAGKYEIAVMEAGPFDVTCDRETHPAEGVSTLVFARAGNSIWQLRLEDPKALKTENAVRLEIGTDAPYLIEPLQGRASIGSWTLSAAQKRWRTSKASIPSRFAPRTRERFAPRRTSGPRSWCPASASRATATSTITCPAIRTCGWSNTGPAANRRAAGRRWASRRGRRRSCC